MDAVTTVGGDDAVQAGADHLEDVDAVLRSDITRSA